MGFSQSRAPVDDSPIAELPVSDAEQSTHAVEKTAARFAAWRGVPQLQRSSRVAVAVDSLRQHRELLAGLLAWEIGKTRRAALSGVDRCIAGIDWYFDHVGSMVEARVPLGLVSNIASWNYPFSVLLLNVLVETLVGNTVVAKAPTQGGGLSLTIAFGFLLRAGLPVSLVSGPGHALTAPLVDHPSVAGLAFVGGRRNGMAIAAQLRGTRRRYALEMEGVNACAVTDFSNWDALRAQIRAGFDFGKQRCTAYTRWVVARPLVPAFVDTYRAAVEELRVGHPLIEPDVDFGPLISAAKVAQLQQQIDAARRQGATLVYHGTLADAAFLPRQSRRTYLPPTLLHDVPTSSELYTREPFGPVDVLVSVDDDAQLIAEANVSGGALVGSIATDDPDRGRHLAARLRAFKVGVNRMRSRGDRDEAFGGVRGVVGRRVRGGNTWSAHSPSAPLPLSATGRHWPPRPDRHENSPTSRHTQMAELTGKIALITGGSSGIEALPDNTKGEVMGKLEGKVAVITGGSSGLALASAKRFVEEGAYVFITGRRQEALDEAVRLIGRNVTGVRGDAANLDDLDRLFDTVKREKGKIDVLYASAGTGEAVPLGEITEQHFDATFGLNTRGTLFTVQKALPLFNDGGSIFMTGSVASVKGYPNFSVYSASKAALRSFARGWLNELKGRNIRVNVLSPGPIATPMQDQVLTEEAKRMFESAIPRGKMGRPEEIAAAAVFLASDDSSFVNGVELSVDGGLSAI